MLSGLLAKGIGDDLLHKNWPQPGKYVPVRRRPVNRALPLVGSGRDRFSGQVVPTEPVQLIELADDHIRRPPIGCLSVSGDAQGGLSREQRFAKHEPAVQFFGENLQDYTRQRGAFQQFPEVRRTAAVEIVVSVVIGPYAVASCSQDLSVKDVEAEAKNNVQILRPNFFHSILGKALNKLLFKRLHFEGFDTRKQIPAIYSGKRVFCRLHARVK